MDEEIKENLRQLGRTVASNVQKDGYEHNEIAQRVVESDRMSYRLGLRVGNAINAILADMEDPD